MKTWFCFIILVTFCDTRTFGNNLYAYSCCENIRPDKPYQLERLCDVNYIRGFLTQTFDGSLTHGPDFEPFVIKNFAIDLYNSNFSGNHHHFFEEIEKPCALHDIHCIRNYLSHKFSCTPVYEQHPEPHYVKSFSCDMPSGNASAVVRDIELFGLNAGKIKTFYINKNTDTMVLEVAFDSVLMKSPHALVSYYRPGKEAIKREDFVTFNFRDFSLTWTVEGIHDNNQRKSHVYGYLSNPHIMFKIGGNLYATNGDNGWITNMLLSIAEANVTQGPMLLSAYLKSNICDLEL